MLLATTLMGISSGDSARAALILTPATAEPQDQRDDVGAFRGDVSHLLYSVHHAQGSGSVAPSPAESADGNWMGAVASDADDLGHAASAGHPRISPNTRSAFAVAPPEPYFPHGATHGVDGTLGWGDDAARSAGVLTIGDDVAVAARGRGAFVGEAGGLLGGGAGNGVRAVAAVAEGAAAAKVVTIGAGAAGAAAVAAGKKKKK